MGYAELPGDLGNLDLLTISVGNDDPLHKTARSVSGRPAIHSNESRQWDFANGTDVTCSRLRSGFRRPYPYTFRREAAIMSQQHQTEFRNKLQAARTSGQDPDWEAAAHYLSSLAMF